MPIICHCLAEWQLFCIFKIFLFSLKSSLIKQGIGVSVGRLFYQVLFLLTVIRLAEVLKFPHRIAIFNSFSPFGCPNTFTIIRNNFFFPPPPDGRNFLCGGRMDLFWNNPFCLSIKHQQIVQLFCNRDSLEGAIIALKQ